MTFPRELGGEKGAVAIGSQACAASLSIRHRRPRGPSTEHCQLREFYVEIDNAGRSAFHFSLHLLTAVCIAARRRARATRSRGSHNGSEPRRPRRQPGSKTAFLAPRRGPP